MWRICAVCGKFLPIRLARMPGVSGMLWLTLMHRRNRNVKTDPVCERCVVRAKPAAGFVDTSQNPVRGLYFGEFITVSDLALTCLGLKPWSFSQLKKWMHFSVLVSCKPCLQGWYPKFSANLLIFNEKYSCHTSQKTVVCDRSILFL